jgi:hypothetical protein
VVAEATGRTDVRLATLALCGLGISLAAPEWVPAALSREDGPVEWASFACFLVGAMCALAAAWRLWPARRPVLLAVAFAAVLVVAAGEEISWGQRLFDVETPAVLVDGNRQDELNLHNLEELQGKAVLAQLAVAAAGLLLPRYVRRPWARVGFPCFAGYLAYRAGRGVAALADWGLADRNSEVAELLLAGGLLAAAVALWLDVRRAALLSDDRAQEPLEAGSTGLAGVRPAPARGPWPGP